ncbi:Re/Si-specific NAD(P)(+) transhydrogenase subunit alpha [Persicimonas caeni]|uniref:NAD(P) transhydrogenase subunit alpha n=1 Tax=Persicimonas caeni TaxID=2292766 RepID=A0A4Y6PMB7_PERCE|nr:Re/Si-specific NAD(P)(+) transhydrogenase subunit alpha [Persicimonas caeni]QDG49187.1 Re/Si-specific NAD(P)(+) transhydrogenase subunit alpha [Persicimonas caeni]QED30408.1 Re/Si-specific NAD(P)(+) transhydrogenase subunit alpha [Persicimonas caeni]
MKLTIPRETRPGEHRVAGTPASVERLCRLGYDVLVERDAGARAGLADSDYEAAGATIVSQTEQLWAQADIVTKVRPPTPDEADMLREGALLISHVWPEQHPGLLDRLAEREATVLSLERVPRISRAQAVDVLSSMAGIAGYRAVIDAAHAYGRFFTPQMSAAGSTPPVRVMVIGAGVAGLAAIAQAHKMGAKVRAFDTREAVREQVESLGAEFLEVELEESGSGEGGYARTMSPEYIEAEMALFAEQMPQTDILITTAAIPGKKAPRLITKPMVESMPSGSVIVDLAVATGGNCELTCPDEVVDHHGVTVLGPTDLANQMPTQASAFFAENVANLVDLLGPADAFELDLHDEIIRGMLLLQDGGEVELPEQPEKPEPMPPRETAQPPEPRREPEDRPTRKRLLTAAGLALLVALFLAVGLYAPAEFVGHFTVFVLACFVGWQLIWNVTPSLHTPLMSVTNAISGIVVVGGILQVTQGASAAVLALAGAAVVVTSINIFGGFWVTQRMLGMFRAESASNGERS